MHFSTVLHSIVFSQFLGLLVTNLSVGAPPAAEAPLCAFQVLREAICGVDLKDTWCQASEGDRDEATLLRLGQPAGTIKKTQFILFIILHDHCAKTYTRSRHPKPFF